MFKRWWHNREDVERVPPVPPSPPGQEISLPNPEEAREALTNAIESRRKVSELSIEIHELLAYIRAGREENNFAEGIVRMIKEGR